jgi:hypothetical protein
MAEVMPSPPDNVRCDRKMNNCTRRIHEAGTTELFALGKYIELSKGRGLDTCLYETMLLIT